MHEILKSYMYNLQASLICSAYTRCWENWSGTDYVPSYNRLYFIIKGEGWLKIGDKEYYPKPGELFLLPSGIKQSFSSINDNYFEKYWCHFYAKVGSQNIFDIIKTTDYIKVDNMEYLIKLFTKLIEYEKDDAITSPILANATLLEIIANFIHNSDVHKISLPDAEAVLKLEQVNNYINDHFSENITLDELADLLHFNASHFIRFFKKNVGITPLHYIYQLRMEKAKMLLKTTDIYVNEVGCRVGYPDVFHFSKAFKKFAGFSPAEFRKITYLSK